MPGPAPDRLEPALVYLQPLALPRRIRGQTGRGRYLLTALRETLAEQIDRPIPTLRSPVRASTVIGLLALGAAGVDIAFLERRGLRRANALGVTALNCARRSRPRRGTQDRAGLSAPGVAPTASVAAVLTFRLTYWLPVLPGIAAFRFLQHRGVI